MKTKVAYLNVLRLTHSLFLLRSIVSELSTILIRRCTSLAHPQIIKIVNNSENVDYNKKKFVKQGVKRRDKQLLF